MLKMYTANTAEMMTYEYAARWCTVDELKTLADYTIGRHFSCPEDSKCCGGNPYLRLLKEVIRRQAELIAQWQLVGFIHGVMNTDNMALSGETIDYGPCAFMDAYDPGTVFSSIDIYGRYAYGRQPGIAGWNLARFAETLLPLLHEDENKAVELAKDAVSEFGELFRAAWLRGMRSKLGIFGEEPQDEISRDEALQDEATRDEATRDEATQDEDLINSLLDIMHRHKADFTNTFRALTYNEDLDIAMFGTDEFKRWKARWHERLGRQKQAESSVFRLMRESNPVIIPRNHRVEEALEAAEKRGDYSIMDRLVRALSRPYENTSDKDCYTAPPGPSFCGYRTFCGT
jgi:uncharacterized protein YdiU (UPF0061 family)